MRVCERHPDRKIRTTLVDRGDGSEIDLCTECREEFRSWAAGELRSVPDAIEQATKRGPGRPKK